MLLVSVNVSLPREIRTNGTTVRTGIFKQPVEGRVLLRRLNLDGDAQGDLSVHGGPDKAVYAYSFEHYAYWKKKLGRDDLPPGQFGENFTVEGMPEEQVCLGDVFRIGEAVVEVTQPRLPCFKLGLKMGDAKFPKQFLASGRLGFYLRVLEEGAVGAGDEIRRVRADTERLTVRELAKLASEEKGNRELAKQALRVAALAASWREWLAERLAEPADTRTKSGASEK
jgi:MOSC domain-containing protein YiiM